MEPSGDIITTCESIQVSQHHTRRSTRRSSGGRSRGSYFGLDVGVIVMRHSRVKDHMIQGSDPIKMVTFVGTGKVHCTHYLLVFWCTLFKTHTIIVVTLLIICFVWPHILTHFLYWWIIRESIFPENLATQISWYMVFILFTYCNVEWSCAHTHSVANLLSRIGAFTWASRMGKMG